MLPFRYDRPASAVDAVARGSGDRAMAYLAGGTELLNWMRDGIVAPRGLLDISRLPLAGVERDPQGGLTIGATTRLADLEDHPAVRECAPALAQAVRRSASPAIRHMSTLAGNLLQRTRCPVYRAGPGVPCNRRVPGTGCGARGGDQRAAAILGASDACIAVHPSDPAVALAALGATITVLGRSGTREIGIGDLQRLPGSAPEVETTLEPSELILSIRVPASAAARHSCYVKLRERAEFDFALVACAAGVQLAGDTIQEVRIALGGVAAKPWRCREAERRLRGPLSLRWQQPRGNRLFELCPQRLP
jgi:xanthine dehydrogenase YagS FAD-binding subunit